MGLLRTTITADTLLLISFILKYWLLEVQYESAVTVLHWDCGRNGFCIGLKRSPNLIYSPYNTTGDSFLTIHCLVCSITTVIRKLICVIYEISSLVSCLMSASNFILIFSVASLTVYVCCRCFCLFVVSCMWFLLSFDTETSGFVPSSTRCIWIAY